MRRWSKPHVTRRKKNVVGRRQTRRKKEISMSTSSDTWHLEKVYQPQTGLTTGDLLHYYRQLAPVTLPHPKDRLVTLRVYPQGVEGTSYYLRDCPKDARRTIMSPSPSHSRELLPLLAGGDAHRVRHALLPEWCDPLLPQAAHAGTWTTAGGRSRL